MLKGEVIIKNLVSILISVAYFCSATISTIANAQIVNSLNPANGREYFVGMSMGKSLFTVNLVNGVNAPGVYHIPADTNLAELFSYAGGLVPESNAEHIFIRSLSKAGETSVRTVSFAKPMTEKGEAFPRLSDRDVIQIEQNQSLDKTVKWMSIVSMAASILTAAIVIGKNK